MGKTFMFAFALCSILLLSNREADAAITVCAPAIQQNKMAVRCVTQGVVKEQFVMTLSFKVPTMRERWLLVADSEISRLADKIASWKERCIKPGTIQFCHSPALTLLELRLEWAVAEYAKARGFRVAERVSW